MLLLNASSWISTTQQLFSGHILSAYMIDSWHNNETFDEAPDQNSIGILLFREYDKVFTQKYPFQLKLFT